MEYKPKEFRKNFTDFIALQSKWHSATDPLDKRRRFNRLTQERDKQVRLAPRLNIASAVIAQPLHVKPIARISSASFFTRQISATLVSPGQHSSYGNEAGQRRKRNENTCFIAIDMIVFVCA